MQPATIEPPPNGGVAVHHHGGFELAIYAAADPTRERPSQDRAMASLDDGQALLAVADGAGGHNSGGQAATITIAAIERAAAGANRDGGALRHAILDALERANREVLDLGDGAATTLASAIVVDSQVRTFHVGDAMVLVVGGRGSVRLATPPHSPVGYAVEAGVLEPEEAMHHEDRHLVSNVVGDLDMRVEVRAPIRMRPHDTVLVASDGLYDNLHLEEIAERIRRRDLETVARELAETCTQRMTAPAEGEPCKPDDLSFILLRRERKRRATRRKPTPSRSPSRSPLPSPSPSPGEDPTTQEEPSA